MALPVIATTRTGALYVWAHDESVKPPDGALGWLPIADATVLPGADVLEVAALSAEDCAVVASLPTPANHYEAARRAVRGRQVRGAKGDRWDRGRQLQEWISSIPSHAAAELSLLAHALAYGLDYAQILSEAYGRTGSE